MAVIKPAMHGAVFLVALLTAMAVVLPPAPPIVFHGLLEPCITPQGFALERGEAAFDPHGVQLASLTGHSCGGSVARMQLRRRVQLINADATCFGGSAALRNTCLFLPPLHYFRSPFQVIYIFSPPGG